MMDASGSLSLCGAKTDLTTISGDSDDDGEGGGEKDGDGGEWDDGT